MSDDRRAHRRRPPLRVAGHTADAAPFPDPWPPRPPWYTKTSWLVAMAVIGLLALLVGLFALGLTTSAGTPAAQAVGVALDAVARA